MAVYGSGNMMLSEFGSKGSAGNDFWNFGADVPTKKLSLVILVYLYANDDGKISFSEKRSFKKIIRSIQELSKVEKDEIISLLDKLPDKNYVVNYIKDNQMSVAVVKAAVQFLKEITKLNKKYTLLLEGIENYFSAYN